MNINFESVEITFLLDVLEDFKERDKRFRFLNLQNLGLLQSCLNKLSSDDI